MRDKIKIKKIDMAKSLSQGMGLEHETVMRLKNLSAKLLRETDNTPALIRKLWNNNKLTNNEAAFTIFVLGTVIGRRDMYTELMGGHVPRPEDNGDIDYAG